jgi:lambda family phage tail tape measure protein
MAAGSLGSLVVSLTAETAQFTASLDRASYNAQKNFKSITSFAKTAAGALAALYGASSLTNFIKTQIDLADATGKMAQKVGISVEELSKLEYAAKLADVSSQQLQGGLVRLTRGMIEAANGTGQAQNAFAALGIKVKNTDGTMKSSGQVLEEVAAKFATYKDGANKTALAVQLFGRAGADLIPLLNAGKDGIKDAGDELAKFGGVITLQAAKNAELFNDNLTRLSTVGAAFGKSIANEILPYLNRLSTEFLVAKANGLGFLDMLQMGLRSTDYDKQIQQIDKSIKELNSSWNNPFFGSKDERLASLERQRKTLVDLQVILNKDLLMNPPKPSDQKTIAPFSIDLEEQKKQQERFAKGLAASEEIVAKFLGGMRDAAAKTQLEMDAVFMSDAQKKRIIGLLEIQKQYENSAISITKQFKDGNLTAKAYGEQIGMLADYYGLATDQAKKLFDNQDELNASWEYGAAVALKQYANEAENMAALTGGVVTNALNNMDDALYNVLAGTMSVADGFRAMVSSILADIAKLMIRQAITAPIAQILSNSFGFGNAGNVVTTTSGVSAKVTDYSSPYISGARAYGGMVTAGSSYLVGEKGAEMFTPSMNGNITPSDALGGTTVVNQTFNISTGVSQTVRSEIQSMMPRIMEATKAAVADSKRRGGTYGAMMA